MATEYGREGKKSREDRTNTEQTAQAGKETSADEGQLEKLSRAPERQDAPYVYRSRSFSSQAGGTLQIRLAQEPLTVHNLAATTSALTQLHAQCWLIATSRFADLVEYTQTRNPSFDEEANLTIAQLTHHSPAEITFNVSLEGVANALRTAIDAVIGMCVLCKLILGHPITAITNEKFST